MEKLEQFRETYERLTAASHESVEYFAKHKKIEGYYEEQATGTLFGCDRLRKQENPYGMLQLGYNPNRKREFLFANLKTSKYDTVASKYQKEMKDYQKKALLKGDNENRAYVSRRSSMATVLIEKKERKPWTESSIKRYLSRANMEAVEKTLPFFLRKEETEELEKLHTRRKEIQQEIRTLQTGEETLETEPKQQAEEMRELRKEAVEALTHENLMEAILIRKAAAARYFLRRINYAYDFQKKDIETYYREKRLALDEKRQIEEDIEDIPEDEDE